MQLLVRHRFDAVEGSGKQHRFSWSLQNPDGSEHFLCHAMYQSGDDKLPVHGGGEATRGHILRIQCDEHGGTAPGHGLALHIHDAQWKEEDYRALATQILHGDLLPTDAHKAAVLTQLASVYNLLATQYSITFDHGIPPVPSSPADTLYNTLDGMITDCRAKALSEWFTALAGQALEGTVQPLPPLTLPQSLPQPQDMEFSWRHEIETLPGNKLHRFFFHGKDQEAIAKTIYQSGALGGSAAFFPQEGKRLAPGFTLDVSNSTTGECASLGENSQTIDATPLTQEQKQAAYVMLASLYRLAGTRYGFPFGHDYSDQPPACVIGNAESANDFVNPPGFVEQARKALLKATALMRAGQPQSQLEDAAELATPKPVISGPSGSP